MMVFQNKTPCHSTELVKFRKRIGSSGVEDIFKMSVSLHGCAIEDATVNIDTTVQEKSITYPTDGKLAIKIINRLNKIAKTHDVKQRRTFDFLLTAKRDNKAAKCFFTKAIASSGKPSLINIDKSGANIAAIKQYNHDKNKRIKIRQCKYLNNVVEQDHRFIKRRTRPMLGFKLFGSARATLAGIELWHMLEKGQNRSSLPVWHQFYELALAG